MKQANKVVSFLKVTLKTILWIVVSSVLIFILVAVLIQFPAIQTRIIHYATSFISSKTHTRIEIKNVRLSFPKSVVIRGLFLEDLKHDTLIYAGNISVNIAFRDLLNHRIHVTSFTLEEAKLNLERTETDSLFNYNFLISAFNDTLNVKKTEPSKKSKWTFSADIVKTKNIKLHYNDKYGGTSISAILKNLTLKMDQIDLAQLTFKIDQLIIDSLNSNILITRSLYKKENKKDGVLPRITANKIQINNTNISYTDSIVKQSVVAVINQIALSEGLIDLQQQLLTLDKIDLSKSELHYSLNDPGFLTDTVSLVNNRKAVKSDWKLEFKRIILDDNSVSYMVENKPEIKNAFDFSHMSFKHLTISATDLYYSTDKISASIQKFTAVDQNNFSIAKFETDFSMDQHSINATKLNVKTTNSAIEADLSIRYSSLKSLKDSLPFMILNLNLKDVTIKTSDVVYFNPELINQPFFKNVTNVTKVSGKISGSVNDLTGKNLVIQTGLNTNLRTDFHIVGLPVFKTAYFDFRDLRINSGRKDISMIADTLIPKSIELPEDLAINVIFKGKIKSFESTLDMTSNYGSAHLSAAVDTGENFRSNVNIAAFDLGRLLRDTALLGTVSLNAETTGHGLNKSTIEAKIIADVSQFSINKYTYHNLNIGGVVSGQKFEGKINLNDENAVFDFDGLVDLNPDQERFKFNLNLKGIDLQKLNFTKNDIRVGLFATADIKGGSVYKLNGKAGITNIIISHEGKMYILDSLLIVSKNEPDKNELSVKSTLINLKYTGTFSPAELPNDLSSFISRYFQFSDSNRLNKPGRPQKFAFSIQLHNHPILSEVFFPQLKEFDPGLIEGSFDSQKNELKFSAPIRKIVYGTTEIQDLTVDLKSDDAALNYKISLGNISNSNIKLDNLLVDGKLSDKKIISTISSIDKKQIKKLLISSQVVRVNADYKLTINPKDFYLMNSRWDIAADNFIEFGKQGFLIHNLFISKAESQVNITSVHDQFNDDLNITIRNFKLDDISRIIEKDTSLVKGNVNGNVLLKRVNGTYGLIADATISNLFVREVPVGNLVVKAENPTGQRFDISVNLSGPENNFTANGYFIPNGSDNSISIKAAIQSLSMKTVAAFSMGTIAEASGTLTGNFLIEGKTTTPDITGELVFNDAVFSPSVLHNKFELKHETVQLKKDGLYFSSFTILDAARHSAIIDGSVKMDHFKNFIFAFSVNTKDFLLFNTTAKENNEYYGRMVIDSKINVTGPVTLPVINAKLKMKKGSYFTFAVPEQKLTAERGEDVVEFGDSLKLNPILTGNSKKAKQKSALTGFDLSSIVEIDKEATLRFLIDPSTTDSLVVKGIAALSFSIDRSGKMSLTGAYNLNNGSYLVSLESILKRKFIIDAGSTIIWNGELLDAEISINATYSVRASPYDLVADQMSGLSETDKNKYKQRYPFLVFLKLRGALSHPEISFEIQLRPEDKGILGGAVDAKLNMLSEDPSALNKQVFALLVLGRFIQENPLQSESNGALSAVRATAGKLISAQLNQWSSKVVSIVELNFDIQSYDDYQTGQAQGRTQVDIGIKKQLFNERLTVQVGGTVDVEGEKAKQNSASDITGDVTVEYNLTKDGRYKLKGFRHNQYEGAIEGQLIETGAGILFEHDFNELKSNKTGSGLKDLTGNRKK